MADKQLAIMIGDKRNHEGRIVNVYDTYANALLHGSSGLVSGVKPIAPLTGAAGSAITQAAKTTGLTIDQFGMIHCYIDDGNAAVFLMSNGHWGAPRKQYVAGL